ncbi:YceI family protein [Frankia sp. Cppng1_Ct_nod]|uniref:YceI family protein n=1 Tax=Frankia sp. Cppng1_Ct_nod TaxID=2897162 RepID=UPI0010415E9B|nr:YceI family protein [Frankia sp. Cppng1_Ct_nod]
MASQATQARIVVPPTAGAYRIDPARSSVSSTSRNFFGLLPVKGTFSIREGRFTVGHPLTASTAHAVVDTASFSTGNRKRDEHVRGKNFLDAVTHPTITFTADEARERDDTWVLMGVLTVHGVTRPIELAVDHAETAGDEVRFHAAARVDRHEFGVTKMKGFLARAVRVHIEVAATRR